MVVTIVLYIAFLVGVSVVAGSAVNEPHPPTSALAFAIVAVLTEFALAAVLYALGLILPTALFAALHAREAPVTGS